MFKAIEEYRSIPALKARIADLEAKQGATAEMDELLKGSEAQVQELTAKLSEATSNHAALEAEKAKIYAEFEEYKSKEGERNAAYAATNITGVARKPLAVNAKDAGDKPDFSKLKGLDRAKAAHIAQNPAK